MTSAAGQSTSLAHSDAPNDSADIGWARALVSGLVILIVGFGGAVYGADWILSAQSMRRAPREWLATGLFFFVVIALAWALRRLQHRKVI